MNFVGLTFSRYFLKKYSIKTICLFCGEDGSRTHNLRYMHTVVVAFLCLETSTQHYVLLCLNSKQLKRKTFHSTTSLEVICCGRWTRTITLHYLSQGYEPRVLPITPSHDVIFKYGSSKLSMSISVRVISHAPKTAQPLVILRFFNSLLPSILVPKGGFEPRLA